MKRCRLLNWGALWVLFFVTSEASRNQRDHRTKRTERKNPRPNVVVITASDLGWDDVSFHGSPQIPTPAIDQLANNGVILNSHYISPSPLATMAELLTGKYAIHLGLQHGVIHNQQRIGIPLNEKLLPQYLKNLGYSTVGVGKWGLGFFSKEYTPTTRGFDSFFGSWTSSSQNYYTHAAFDGTYGLDLRRNSEVVLNATNVYSTELFTKEACSAIEVHDIRRPLFLSVFYPAVHTANADDPLQVPSHYLNELGHIKNDRRRLYAGMVKALDEGVGNITKALIAKGIFDNTVLLFLSNAGGAAGGLESGVGSNYPLRGAKLTVWEGGIRSVAFVHSSLLKKRSRVSYELMHVTDWLPTLVGLAGGRWRLKSSRLNGIDVWNSLSDSELSPRFEMPHVIDPLSGNLASIRVGDFKVVLSQDLGFYGDWYSRPSDMEELDALSPPAVLPGAVLRCDQNYPNPLLDMHAPPCNPMRGPCLFNIRWDPCEYHNLAIMLPNTLQVLIERMIWYKMSMKAPIYPSFDLRSDPELHNGVWDSWEEYNYDGHIKNTGRFPPLDNGGVLAVESSKQTVFPDPAAVPDTNNAGGQMDSIPTSAVQVSTSKEAEKANNYHLVSTSLFSNQSVSSNNDKNNFYLNNRTQSSSDVTDTPTITRLVGRLSMVGYQQDVSSSVQFSPSPNDNPIKDFNQFSNRPFYADSHHIPSDDLSSGGSHHDGTTIRPSLQQSEALSGLKQEFSHQNNTNSYRSHETNAVDLPTNPSIGIGPRKESVRTVNLSALFPTTHEENILRVSERITAAVADDRSRRQRVAEMSQWPIQPLIENSVGPRLVANYVPTTYDVVIDATNFDTVGTADSVQIPRSSTDESEFRKDLSAADQSLSMLTQIPVDKDSTVLTYTPSYYQTATLTNNLEEADKGAQLVQQETAASVAALPNTATVIVNELQSQTQRSIVGGGSDGQFGVDPSGANYVYFKTEPSSSPLSQEAADDRSSLPQLGTDQHNRPPVYQTITKPEYDIVKEPRYETAAQFSPSQETTSVSHPVVHVDEGTVRNLFRVDEVLTDNPAATGLGKELPSDILRFLPQTTVVQAMPEQLPSIDSSPVASRDTMPSQEAFASPAAAPRILPNINNEASTSMSAAPDKNGAESLSTSEHTRLAVTVPKENEPEGQSSTTTKTTYSITGGHLDNFKTSSGSSVDYKFSLELPDNLNAELPKTSDGRTLAVISDVVDDARMNQLPAEQGQASEECKCKESRQCICTPASSSSDFSRPQPSVIKDYVGPDKSVNLPNVTVLTSPISEPENKPKVSPEGEAKKDLFDYVGLHRFSGTVQFDNGRKLYIQGASTEDEYLLKSLDVATNIDTDSNKHNIGFDVTSKSTASSKVPYTNFEEHSSVSRPHSTGTETAPNAEKPLNIHLHSNNTGKSSSDLHRRQNMLPSPIGSKVQKPLFKASTLKVAHLDDELGLQQRTERPAPDPSQDSISHGPSANFGPSQEAEAWEASVAEYDTSDHPVAEVLDSAQPPSPLEGRSTSQTEPVHAKMDATPTQRNTTVEELAFKKAAVNRVPDTARLRAMSEDASNVNDLGTSDLLSPSQSNSFMVSSVLIVIIAAFVVVGMAVVAVVTVVVKQCDVSKKFNGQV